MKKNSFKYELGEKVFLIGYDGVSVVSARGQMDFMSGGKMNFYCLLGARSGSYPENALQNLMEKKVMLRDYERIKI
jgi:hypothetical protein